MLRGLRWLRWERWREAPEADEAGARPFVRGAMLAGLVAVMLLCLFFPVPRLGSLPPRKLLVIAGGLLFDAIAVSVLVALAVLGMRSVLSKGPLRVSGMTLRATWVTAIWVPAWIFALWTPSLVTVLAGCFLMATGALYLRRYEGDAADAGFSLAARREESRGLLTYPFQFDSELWPKVLLPSLGLALLVELTATVAAMSSFRWASLLAGMCVTLLVWRARSGGSGEASNKRAVGALALAFVSTLVVLLPYLRNPPLSRAITPMLKESGTPASRGAAGTDDGYSGIILLTPKEEHKKIELPVRKEEATVFTGRLPQAIEIPFDGAYWYFKSPDKRPRPTARVVQGSSLKATVRSTDWYPLLMEAHQRLDPPMDLSCCGGIDIVVQNADKREGAIALELWVKGKGTPDSRGYYLGSASMQSRQTPAGARGDTPVEERLSYVVPSRMEGVKFDEITVVVRSAPARWREGAKIGIKKFVLEP
ncbi:hypothetical protein [Edaphobacter bradus]|uniref:hypothetical protein n=1 Tax=Edaphobacter bradus TaxID=2259016 RepID=UPI0021DFB775|nr:hypothetical protein [Edaphobacter bradus]